MVISFQTYAGRSLHLVRGPRAGESRDPEKGKVICITRGSQRSFAGSRPEPEDWPDFEPPKGA
jgi:hypothetical protein